jgi:hypothetical protein
MQPNSNTIKQWLADCNSIAEEALSLRLEGSKLVSGWQRVDKLRMDAIIQSVYHMNWSLAGIAANMDEVTREPPPTREYTLEEIRYDDYESLTAPELETRTKAWYADAKNMHVLFHRALVGISHLGHHPRVLGFLSARLGLDLEFFARQAERAGVTL